MAKLSRKQLKSLVKECLVEILAEGLAEGSPAAAEIIKESLRAPRPPLRPAIGKSRRAPMPNQNPALDAVSYGSSQPTSNLSNHGMGPPRSDFGDRVKNSVSALTSDPVMSSIFADTATTTLQEQIQADGRPGVVSMEESVAPGQDIMQLDIFSEGAKNWATLAFADSPKKS